MVEQTRVGGQTQFLKSTIWGIVGLIIFIGLPEVARRIHGGAFAQTAQSGSPSISNNNGIIAPNNQGIVTQGQSGGTNVINPGPVITASPQASSRSNDPTAPWQTVFTISTTAPVQTGDLRLTCSGPYLKAGISRISDFGLMTGSINGPILGDANSVIYELGPETLQPGRSVVVSVFSIQPVTVVSGSIGAYKINF